ncbi:MAG: hypothetical protein AVDCRST_MAG56-1971 [uncultured Cytophagales bacterium]|uniref:Uncharacterized protein n=1 Tax=uncultured Cytophagales bacterium TaxID=158755 RepID=A0A6J4IGE1_9SPHI|nr:MAG: hypothetical protein AVDCRST_MAG56-1971 [uncultured Cytophagales bacterium]
MPRPDASQENTGRRRKFEKRLTAQVSMVTAGPVVTLRQHPPGKRAYSAKQRLI